MSAVSFTLVYSLVDALNQYYKCRGYPYGKLLWKISAIGCSTVSHKALRRKAELTCAEVGVLLECKSHVDSWRTHCHSRDKRNAIEIVNTPPAA